MRNFSNPTGLAMTMTALTVLALAPAEAAAQAPEPATVRDGAVHGYRLPPSNYHLGRNHLVTIELLETVGTSASTEGAAFRYRIVDDVVGDGGVVIPKNSQGEGIILKARKGSKHGAAKLHLDFGEVPSVEGRPVKLGFNHAAVTANPRIGTIPAIIGGYFTDGSWQVTLDKGTRIVTAVEYPYGTRRIQAGEHGVSYRPFSGEPVTQTGTSDVGDDVEAGAEDSNPAPE